MDLSNGTPNLLTHTRLLVGDPAGTSTQFTDAEVKSCINLAYREVVQQMRIQDPSGFSRIAYTSTEDSYDYELPTGFDGGMSLDIDYDGVDLRTSDGNAKRMAWVPNDQYWSNRNAAASNTYIYTFLHDHFLIYPKPTTLGEYSIRLTYDYSPPDLSQPTDEPEIPPAHHELIAVRAAIRLKVSRDLDIGLLASMNSLLTRNLMLTAGFRSKELPVIRSSVSYRKPYKSNVGRIIR